MGQPAPFSTTPEPQSDRPYRQGTVQRSHYKHGEPPVSQTQTIKAEREEDFNNQQPTYCCCKRGDCGEIVACDSGKCQAEWFHLQCSGLITSPPRDCKFRRSYTRCNKLIEFVAKIPYLKKPSEVSSVSKPHADTIPKDKITPQTISQQTLDLNGSIINTQSEIEDVSNNLKLKIQEDLVLSFIQEGQWKEAETLEVKIIEMKRRWFGFEDRYTLDSTDILAVIFNRQGRQEEAENLLLQIIETRKKMFSVEHPSTLMSMSNLAVSLYYQGKMRKAEKLQKEIVEKRIKLLGVEHPDTLTNIEHLAATLGRRKNFRGAKKLKVQVIKTRKNTFGAQHPSTMASIANLVVLLNNQGQLEAAEKIGIQVMEMRERSLGAEYPDTLNSMRMLITLRSSQERWEDVEKLVVKLIEKNKRVLGAEHPGTLHSMKYLGMIFSAQGRLKEAEKLQMPFTEAKKRVSSVDRSVSDQSRSQIMGPAPIRALYPQHELFYDVPAPYPGFQGESFFIEQYGAHTYVRPHQREPWTRK